MTAPTAAGDIPSIRVCPPGLADRGVLLSWSWTIREGAYVLAAGFGGSTIAVQADVEAWLVQSGLVDPRAAARAARDAIAAAIRPEDGEAR